MNDNAKALLTSKTVWGALLMVLGAFLPEMKDLDLGPVSDALVTFAGFVLTIYGRIKAERPIRGVVRP